MYSCNLIRERRSEDEIFVDTFFVEDSVTDPEQALRSAVKEFLATNDGKKAITHSCNDFNWGDAVTHVPEKIWNKHGLKFNDFKSVEVKVNQDEVLMDEIGEDE